MDFIQESLIDPVSNFLWNYVLIYVLVGAGLFFTLRTRFVQVRLFGQMVKGLRSSGVTGDGISSFQAFAIGLASRVGTGNIAGVAIAITVGGPGAIFWMWVVAAIGMATALVEATLAQVYKRRKGGTFVGGPAYYIQRGLGSRAGAVTFAVILILTFGLVFSMVQANTITDVAYSAHGLNPAWVAVALGLLAAPILFGGVRRVAKISEKVMPALAGIYVLIALVIMVLNLNLVPQVLGDIVSGAFGFSEIAGGGLGAMAAAMLSGAKRGLFSNEAGMGSAPNAAATATVEHPVRQGLIQSLGVFVDTMVVCSATAFIVLCSGVYVEGVTDEKAGASLTQAGVAEVLGDWTLPVMTFLIFVFAFTSVLGNYSYAEVNLELLTTSPFALNAFRILVVAAVIFGGVVPLQVVWSLADVAMALMALVNLVAISLLGRVAFVVLRDWEAQMRAGKEPFFVLDDHPELAGKVDSDVWGRDADAMNTRHADSVVA